MGRVSSEDIAREAQVSRATVSYVLNNRPGRRISEETRRRVLRTARSLGYVPNPAAMALRSGSSKIVLLQESVKVPASGQHILRLGSTSGMLRDAVAREVRSWGMTLVSSNVGFPLAEALSHFTPALVLAPAGMSDDDRSSVARAGIPYFETLGDGRAAFAAVTESLTRTQILHLQDRGHRRIGHITTDIDELADIAQERQDWLLSNAATLNIDFINTARLGPVEVSLDACTELLREWRADGITAVSCFNDLYAGLVLKAVRRLGWHIPEDLAVIGVDDDAMSWLLDPPLTTVRLRMAAFGSYVAACGRAVLDDQSPPSIGEGLTPLAIRGTT